jgi:GNAT superfamily N-acetyltransferase
MTELSILPASKNDVDAICHLLAELFVQEADFAVNADKQANAVNAILASPEQGQILVLKMDNQLVGMVSLLYLISTAMGGKVAMLEDMIIAPEQRSQGLGQQLLNAAITFAREQGCLRITLLTDADNQRAQQFYQRQGFVRSAMVPMRHVFED